MTASTSASTSQAASKLPSEKSASGRFFCLCVLPHQLFFVIGVTKLLRSTVDKLIICPSNDLKITMGKGVTMLTAIKNVFVSYLISMSELHPEVTRF
ncbi:hypothetical protein ACM26X_07100 [Kluyvera cryocrescens]|uniref:Uncharacterized protein n=1 Tax=Kluyvera cryocrescens TaxID=580 RepID=A0AAW9CB89_KLUCR|nr:hypothetical protein [Kluyvera cryocrescens]MDW3779601.1 hypothetical protein [Kluyvera cryocrescens]